MTTMERGSWSPARLCKIEKLPLPILDHFLRYFDNYKIKECQVNFETMWETKSLVCWSPQSATVQDFTGAWWNECYIKKTQNEQHIEVRWPSSRDKTFYKLLFICFVYVFFFFMIFYSLMFYIFLWVSFSFLHLWRT